MLPLIPYNGFLRPLLVLFATGTTLVLLWRTYRKSCFPAVLWAVCAGYIFLLLYATLLSRTPSDVRTYRLEPFASLKGALEMAEGTGLSLKAPQVLEGIFLNLCLCVPVGYLLPLALLQRGKRLCFWQVICAGAAVSAVIELTQFVTCLGMLEMDDWLLNTMGTALGGLLYRKLFPLDMRANANQTEIISPNQLCGVNLKMLSLSAETRAMLNLLACELFGREMEIDVSKVDWHRFLAEADRHVLTAFLYPGLRHLNGVPEEILSRARNAAMLSAARMEESLRAQDGVLELMRSRGIPCAVLKGFSAACRYPHPELRVPGDVDLLVGNENLERACAALEQAGYRRDHETEMHVNFVGSGLSLEVHRSASVFPDTEKGRAARAYMEQALRHTEQVELHGYAIPVLAVPYQLVSLLAHMERHMGQAGIGLRQICDWAVAVQARRAQIGEDELQTLERCGLLPFAQVITKLCERYLGLPPLAWAQGAPDALADAVMNDVLGAGNFHVQEGERRISGVMMARGDQATKENTVVHNYIDNIRRRVRQNYPWAKSRLWLPLFCAYFPLQWFYRVLRGKRTPVRIHAAIRLAKSRERLLRSLKLYQ